MIARLLRVVWTGEEKLAWEILVEKLYMIYGTLRYIEILGIKFIKASILIEIFFVRDVLKQFSWVY